MSKPATHTGNRPINPAGEPAEFLKEEPFRGRLPGEQLVYPRPQYVQPDTGAHNLVGGSLDLGYNLAAQRMHYGNDTEDLDGGYYSGGHSG